MFSKRITKKQARAIKRVSPDFFKNNGDYIVVDPVVKTKRRMLGSRRPRTNNLRYNGA